MIGDVVAVWKLNGDLLSDLGVELAEVVFRTQGISYALIDAAVDLDGAQLFAYDEAVLLTRVDTVPDPDGGAPVTTAVDFFRGTIRPIGKTAAPEYEGHSYVIEDAWSAMERTIYQETWWTKVGAVLVAKYSPRAVLAIQGQTIDEMIAKVVNFAASVGVPIQMGACPAGEQLFASEVTNASCAEVLMTCLKHHPDWTAWIDHATTPPTFNVTAVGEMEARTPQIRVVDSPENFVDTVSRVRIAKRDDLLPSAVRVVYETAMTYEDEVYRQIEVDDYPGGSNGTSPAGPNTLTVFIPLEGLQMQMQKSRVETRTIPTGVTSPDADTVKQFIKRKYPALRNAGLTEFTVTGWSRELMVEDVPEGDKIDPPEDRHPDFPALPKPISPRAKRIHVTDAADLPRELISGQIEDWMRRKVGQVRIAATVTATGTATPETVAAIANGLPPIVITATNASTKLYKGVSQWIDGEDMPTGIAAATYNAIHAAMKYEGEVELTFPDVPATRYHGCVLNLAGSEVAHATMASPIHTVSCDIAAGTVSIGFGPVPDLAPQDFLELQRMLRHRPVKWWSTEERDSAEFGAEGHASAVGDSVAGFDAPVTIYETAAPAAAVVPLHILGARPAYIPAPVSPPAEGYQRYYIEWGTLQSKIATNWNDHFDINATTFFFAKATLPTIGPLAVTSWEIVTGAAIDTHETPDWETGDDRPATAVHLLGSVLVVDGVHAIFQNAGGSLVLTEHIVYVTAGTYGGTLIRKQMGFIRLNY